MERIIRTQISEPESALALATDVAMFGRIKAMQTNDLILFVRKCNKIQRLAHMIMQEKFREQRPRV